MLVLHPGVVKNARTRKAWSQQDLAERARMDVMTISRVETGRVNPRPGTLRKIAEALGVEPHTLIAGAA
jgi:transcriptional regulator with XRE-family HTH domain